MILMGVKVFQNPYVTGSPVEYILASSSGNSWAINQLVKVGTTGAGKLEHLSGTTPLALNSFITLRATTGSTVDPVPVMRIQRDIKYIVDHCSSETVRSTTDQGLTCAISSSGGAVVASTGAFKIEVIGNTSDTQAQYVIGTFMISSTY
jgi:hypothetical protein